MYDVAERAVTRLRFPTFEEGYRLSHLSPKFGVVCRLFVGMNFEVKFGKEELPKVE